MTRLLWLVVLCAAASLAITGSQCAQLTGSRKFLSVDGSDDDREPPAVLWTTPGAGNTWVRQLIEYATGVHTGSMYNDESIESQMPGEKRCDRSVVVVKGHPEHRTFDMVFNASREDPCENSPYTTRSVCLKQFAKYVSSCGGRPDFFRRAVAVVRDPFKTLLAEYQRFTKQEADRLSRTQSKGSGAHTSVMRDLDPKAFSEWALPAARRMIEDWRQYARLAKLGRDRIHFVRYEDLMARNLRALADLVGFVTPTFAQPGGGKAGSRQQAGVNRQQLQCAFEQASGGAFRRSTVDKRQLENRAFLSVVGPHTNETTACALWRVFGALGSRLGYAPPGVCGTAEIEKVGGDILALADRARTAGLARPRSVAAPVDSRLFLPACGPQKVSVRVKDHGTYVAVARLSCERTLEEESVIVRSERTTTTTLVGLQVIQTKSAAPKNSAAHQQSQQQQQQRRSSSSSSPQQRVYVRKRLYEKMIEVPLEQTKDWKWRGFGSLMLNPGSFDVVVEDASRHEEVCRFSHVALIGSANTSTAEVSYSLVSDTNPLVWDCGEGETSKTNKRRSIALELLRKRAIRKTIVLTACTKELAAIALNWAVHLERSSIFNYALGALDDETMTRLGSTLGGPVFRVPTRESRHAASFFDVVLGVPELSVLYVDVRAVLVSSHVQSMLQSQPHLGMRCAPVSHCSTLLWMPRADTPEKMSNRERLVEELSVLRPLPESRTSSSLAPLDKPAWPSLNAALNSIDCVTPWTHQGQDVVENFCGGQQQLSPSSPSSSSSSRDDPRRIEDVDDDDDKRGRGSQLVAAYALCPRRLQILKQKAHSKRFKVFFENEYQTDLGWTLTPYARYVIDSAVKAKGNGASSDVLPRIDFFSDLLAHIESLPKSPPRNLLKFTKDYSAFTAAKVPALTVIVAAPRATSMQAQVESFGAAAVAAEATFELVFVLREKNDVLRRSFPYKPYNLWATLSVVLVRDESDYVPKSPWIARLANDALVSTNFGYWFARFRLSVDASENVRVVAPCVATVANVLHGSSPTDDKDFDRLDCAESTTVSGKLECHAWLADHISLVHVNGMKRKYVADSSSSSSKSGGGWTSSFEKNTTGGSLAAAGQLAVRSLYAKIGAIASLASWKPPSLSKVTTTRSLESCGAMMGRESDSPIGDDAGAVFEMRSSSTTTTKGARVEILPSALMVMRHEETRPAAMPTSSSSSHSSKAKKFERLTPQKAIADLDLFGSPDKALETLAAMNVFVFAVETLGGLANRLRAVSTNWALSAKLGRPMIVSWPIDPECEAQPGSLFDLERSVKLPFVNRSWPNPRSPGVSSSKLNKIVKNIETHVRDVASKKAMMPPRAKPERGVIILTNTVLGGATVSPPTEEATDAQKQKQGAPSPAPSPPPPPLERPVHLYARTQRHAVYSRYWSFFLGYTTLDVRAALIGLRPSDFVTSRIRTEYSKVVDAVGLHVRMQWNETESVRGLEGSRDTELRSHFHQDNKKNLEAYHERREDCHLNNFRAYLSEKFLKPASTANRVSPPQAKEDIKFFVACDVTGCLDQFDSDDRAGHVVRDLQHHRQLVESDCFRDSRSSRCQQLAFVEIHLLASCKSLLISRHSSFSDIASLLSRSFRPNDDMVYGGSPRDMAVQSACGYLDERSRKNATLSSASSPSSSNSSAALQRKFGFPFTPSASAVVQEGSRHGRPTRAEIYRKQLFMIQAQRRKQQQQQQQHAATYSILKSTPFGATINNPNDPLVN